MAVTDNVKSISLIAGADLSAQQFGLLVVNASGQVVLAGAGADVDGVLFNAPIAGRVAEVAIDGVVKVKAGGVFAAGANLASNAAGLAVVATTGQAVFGKALEAGAVGRIVSVLFQARPAAAS